MIPYVLCVMFFFLVAPLIARALYAIIVREPWEKKEHWWEYKKGGE